MQLPQPLREITGDLLKAERPTIGTNSDVTLLAAVRGRFVLKRGRTPKQTEELYAESLVLSRLQSAVPQVPQALGHWAEGDEALFLFSFVEGQDLVEVLQGAGPAERRRLMVELGQALHRLHEWTPALPRPARWLQAAVDRAAANVAAGLFPGPFSDRFLCRDADPAALLAELQAWAPGVEPRISFTHGDFCLPNALVQHGHVTAVIDWSQGGYADSRVDLAAGAWSTYYNTGSRDCVEAFLEGYGWAEGMEALRPWEALWVLVG